MDRQPRPDSAKYPRSEPRDRHPSVTGDELAGTLTLRAAAVSNPMPRLFTYTIPIDDGAAPNPFREMCSLAICKPGIRRAAKPGDWVAGLGSKDAPSGDLSGHLVYAMHVESVLSLREYDEQAPTEWPYRI